MQYFCGTDIIEVDRIKSAICETNGFLERIFTKDEIIKAENKSDIVKYEYFAGRFAAKEAVYKALSGINSDLFLSHIEILNDLENKNRPVVNMLDSELAKVISEGKLKMDVSISHLEKYATATCIAIFEN